MSINRELAKFELIWALTSGSNMKVEMSNKNTWGMVKDNKEWYTSRTIERKLQLTKIRFLYKLDSNVNEFIEIFRDKHKYKSFVGAIERELDNGRILNTKRGEWMKKNEGLPAWLAFI